MEQIKNKNSFLVSCMICIVFLLTFCYFGINSSLKSTYSATKSCPVGTTKYTVKDSAKGDFDVCLIHSDTEIYASGSYGSYICSVDINSSDLVYGPSYFESQDYECEDNGNGTHTCDYSVSSNQLENNNCWVFPTTEEEEDDLLGKYVIYFNKNNTGSVSNMPTTVTKDYTQLKPFTEVDLPADVPTVSGNTFVEWNTEIDGSGLSFTAGDVVGTNLNNWIPSNASGYMRYELMLYAIWEDSNQNVVYDITYDANGGKFSDNTTVKVDKRNHGDANYMMISDVPTRDGYTFLGWDTVKNSGIGVYPFADIYDKDGNVTFYAQWSGGGQLVLSFGGMTAEYTGSPVVAPNPTATLNGQKVNVSGVMSYYTDSSCKTSTSGGSAPVDAGTYYVKYRVYATTQYTATETVCTKFTIAPKEISVSWGGGTSFTYNGSKQGPTATVDTKVTGETMKLSTTSAANVGSYTSKASCSSVTGGRAKCNNYKLLNDTKAYTIVSNEPTNKEETFIATFDKNGGVLSGDATKSCTTTGSSCNINGLPSATRDGYTFNGWGTSSSCTNGEKNSLTLSKNTTYYACYSKNQVTPPADDKNVDTNPTTGDIAIALTWFVGLLAVGYSFYYFKSVKEN